MKVELKPIIDQLNEAIGLPVGMTVAAIIDNEELLGWIIAHKMPDGQIIPVSKSKTYPTIKYLLPLKETLDKMMMDAIKSVS
jgi:hypothetical protein